LSKAILEATARAGGGSRWRRAIQRAAKRAAQQALTRENAAAATQARIALKVSKSPRGIWHPGMFRQGAGARANAFKKSAGGSRW